VNNIYKGAFLGLSCKYKNICLDWLRFNQLIHEYISQLSPLI